jgi:serine protease Do
MFKKLILLVLASSVLIGVAEAETLALTGKMRWLALASAKDKDVAIGIARRSNYMANTVKMVSSKSGYYGVIVGPFAAQSIIELKKQDKDGRLGDLPSDALLSKGDNYIDTVWQAKQGGIGAIAYSIDKSAEFSSGSLSIKIQGQKLEPDHAYTSTNGKDGFGTFNFDIGKDLPTEELASAEEFAGLEYNKAAVAKLSAQSPLPQVVVTNYTGGAHCCTMTSILSRDTEQAAWSKTKGEILDGDGYWFEDLDGDGSLEMMSVDNRFLYAFDSYAGSVAPIKIGKYQNGKIEDVTDTPAMHSRLVQDLAAIEFEAKLRPEIWKENGFLAGWMASKIRLGEGDAAWKKVARNMKDDIGFGPQICKSGQKIEDCPSDQLKSVPILKGLATFLKESGYVPLPAAAEALTY